MTEQQKNPVYELRIQAVARRDGADTSALKRLLKCMLRSFGYRCLAITQAPGSKPTTPGIALDERSAIETTNGTTDADKPVAGQN